MLLLPRLPRGCPSLRPWPSCQGSRSKTTKLAACDQSQGRSSAGIGVTEDGTSGRSVDPGPDLPPDARGPVAYSVCHRHHHACRHRRRRAYSLPAPSRRSRHCVPAPAAAGRSASAQNDPFGRTSRQTRLTVNLAADLSNVRGHRESPGSCCRLMTCMTCQGQSNVRVRRRS